MRLIDYLILFLLDEKTHRIHLEEWTNSCVVSGAVILDLIFQDRISVDSEGLVTLVETAATNDPVGDHILSVIAENTEPQTLATLVENCALHADRIIDAVLGKLVADEVIVGDKDGNYELSNVVLTSGLYPEAIDPSNKIELINRRLLKVLLIMEEPNQQEVAIICLGHICGEFQRRLTSEQMELAVRRIQEIQQMDSSVTCVIEAVQRCFKVVAMRAQTSASIPTMNFREFLSPTMRRGDMGRWLGELGQKYGPVFILPQPGNKQVVLASAEANCFFEKHGWKYARAKDYVTGYEEVYGCPGSFLSTDGAEHAHLRQMVFKRGAIRVLEDRIYDIYALFRKFYGRWTSGDPHLTQFECQTLMGKTIAEIGLNINADHIIEDLKAYEERVVKTQIMHIMPGFMMRTPRMLKIRRKLDRLVDEILTTHTPAQRKNKPRDMADEIILQHRADPYSVPTNHLAYSFLSILIGGQNLGNLLSFTLYELLKHPQLLEEIRGEADALFDGVDPDADRFQTDAVDLTERFFMETARLHPVGAGSLRTAKNGFEISGKWITPGTSLLIAFAAPHYFEEHYKDVDKFDPDRFKPERAEHLKPGVYAPFGCDGHRCPMHRWTRLLIILNLLMITYHLDLELSPLDYELRKQPYPTTSPDKNFKFRVKSIRHPLKLS